MEMSFRVRVDQAFGALHGCSLRGSVVLRSASPAVAPLGQGGPGAPAGSWSVSDVAIPPNPGSGDLEESSGSESDGPCGARYEKFVQLARRARKRRKPDDGEDLNEEDGANQGRGTMRARGIGMVGQVPADIGQDNLDEDEECRQVRLMVGMDDTLDFEEEEDEFDKVAVGREGDSERVYMREIQGASCSSCPLSTTPDQRFERKRFSRDSRANHAAAVARLKEDDRLAAVKNEDVAGLLAPLSSSSSVRVLDNNREFAGNIVDMIGISNVKAPSSLALNRSSDKLHTTANGTPELEGCTSSEVLDEATRPSASVSNTNMMCGDDGRETRKESKDSKKRGDDGSGDDPNRGKVKRVRFAVEDNIIDEKFEPVPPKRNSFPRVPDHVRNPSKYTHYTLDWSDEEDENKSNLTAFHATKAATRASEEVAAELPKSVTFTRRSGELPSTKRDAAKPALSCRSQQSQALVSFAEEGLSDEKLYLEESARDVVCEKALGEAKNIRVFRKRAQEHGNDDSN